MMMGENWISKALPKTSRGKLHRELGIKEGTKIPEKKLEKAEKSKSPKIRKQVALARTLKKLHN